MNDYFFISSPLHFLIAANIAIQNPQSRRVAVLISKTRGSGARYRVAAGKTPEIFSQVMDLSDAVSQGRGTRSSVFGMLKDEFSQPVAMRLFTGNDRRMEFQYAMHIASRAGRQIEGIYMDEGAVTYVGHKSMHSIQHRYIDPFFKKLFYGFWYRNAMTTGTSAWVRSAYVAFPELVHPLLKRKRLVAIDAAPFKTPLFRALVSAMLAEAGCNADMLQGLRLVLTLPHEGSYIRRPEMYQALSRCLREHYEPSAMAIKPHPRITNHHILEQMFPGMTLLDSRIGMEMLLPLLNDGCIVAGDISSTLLTTRWLRPDLQVLALSSGEAAPAAMASLYRQLQIPMLAVGQLDGVLPPARRSGGGACPGA